MAFYQNRMRKVARFLFLKRENRRLRAFEILQRKHFDFTDFYLRRFGQLASQRAFRQTAKARIDFSREEATATTAVRPERFFGAS